MRPGYLSSPWSLLSGQVASYSFGAARIGEQQELIWADGMIDMHASTRHGGLVRWCSDFGAVLLEVPHLCFRLSCSAVLLAEDIYPTTRPRRASYRGRRSKSRGLCAK